jgi:hypothetical protein
MMFYDVLPVRAVFKSWPRRYIPAGPRARKGKEMDVAYDFVDIIQLGPNLP